MDLIHKATKLIDHNRGAVAGGLILIASLATAGCQAWDGKVVSSSSGELVNADQRQAEYILEARSLERRDSAAESKIAEAMRELEAVEADAAMVDADYDFDREAIAAEVAARTEGIGQLAEAAVAQVPAASWILPWLTIGTTALAGGVAVDNRRKDKVIKRQKTGEQATT